MAKSEMRMSASTALALAVVVGAAAFAAGRATVGPSSSASADRDPSVAAAPALHSAEGNRAPGPLPPGHAGDLPPGHPPADMPPGHPPVSGSAGAADPAAGGAVAELTWKAPPRWEKVPNTSSMRLATYRVPRAEGDGEDAELSVTQAGGSIDANVERWMGQFGEEGRRTAKRTTRKVGSLDVTVVEVEGTFSGGMGPKAGAEKGWALLGAIVATPGMPHFFKLTGPVKSVKAAKAEFDQLVGSVATSAPAH